MIIYQDENIGKHYDFKTNMHERYTTPHHIHEFSELAYTYRGITTVYVNGTKYQIPEKHGMLILPNQSHEYVDETDSQMRCYVFSNDMIPLVHQRLNGRTFSNPIAYFGDKEALFTELGQCRKEQRVRISGLLNLICDHLMESSDLIVQSEADHHLIHDAVRYVAQHFRQDITLKDVAQALGYHEKYLSKELHALTKVNFRMFLAQYRIDYAKNLLLDTDLSITDIAYECGYNATNTFNRVFRQLSGMTPSAYTKQKRNE